LRALDQLAGRLEIRASRSGRVFAADQPTQNETSPRYFERNAEGCKVGRGGLLGVIGDPNALSGFIPIAQSELELIRVGDRAKVFVPQDRECWGTVHSVAVSSAEIGRHQDLRKAAESDTTVVEMRFDAPVPLIHGSTSTVAILGERMTALQMVVRSLRTAFYW
jgi:hypothetical protein